MSVYPSKPSSAARRAAVSDDLLQRLRFLGEGEPLRGPLMCRSADEIERLRAEVARYKVLYIDCHNALDETKRELAALRERIDKAPVRYTYVEGEHGRELVWLCDEVLPKEFKSHRVRLLVEDAP